ncbi:hypothetical protein [Pantanalinema sp. GBBB05]|uniref:hypothetical protein n=1 Tax=Pantanalinema sp. GBBB05 TaxID=2604139 RepID=UPI001D440806|nr:hypothetical protein [Pantanalinema sp. GBBB05]
MFIIDLTIRNTAMTLSVQRKTQEEAEAVYQQVLEAIRSGGSSLLELTCDYQVGKKVSVVSSDISAVQLYEKSSTATASGRPPGFFALAE